MNETINLSGIILISSKRWEHETIQAQKKNIWFMLPWRRRRRRQEKK